MKKKVEIKDDRKRKFIEECARGVKPYRAALNAGYSETTANTKASKMARKMSGEIEELKPIVKEAIQEEFKYTAKESFRKLEEIQNLALLQDDKGNFNNLSAAIKAEELKGRLFGAYEQDNSQKAAPDLNIIVKRKD